MVFLWNTRPEHFAKKISPETLRNKQKLIIKEMLIASVPIACFSDIYMINAFILRSSMTALLFLQEQYIFVYDVLLEALICGDTTMAAASYPKTLSEMLEYDQSIGKTKLEEQFEVKFYGFFSFLLLWNLSAYQHFQFKKLLRHVYQWLLPAVYFSPSNSILKCWKNFFDIISWLSILSLILFFFIVDLLLV